MQITKFGHSCVLLDDGQTKILFDPGSYSEIPAIQVDGIVITHVHQDHLDIEKLQAILKNCSPKIITNSEVKVELDKYNIECEVVEQGGESQIRTFNFEAIGNDHAIMHPDLPKFQNTGYILNENILHPGDTLIVPTKNINLLLLPIAAPWSKVEETLDYLSEVKPKICFPIHDGFLNGGGAFYRFTNMWCEKLSIEFIQPELGQSYEV